MAFEREAIAPSANAVPSQQPMEMREERVINPYQSRGIAKIGQSNIDSSGQRQSPTEEPVKAPDESVSLSPAAAALARKEQKFRQEHAALKAREAELEKEKLEIADLRAMKEKLAAKDYSAIEGMVPYDEYTSYQVNKLNGQSPEAKALDELRQDLEGLKKSQQDDVTKRFEAAVSERRTAVQKLVQTDSQFLGIKALKAEEAVVQHILDTWEHENVDLNPEQAAREVEEIIKEREQKWMEISKQRQPQTETADNAKAELPPLKSSVNTLTNNMNATGEIKRPNRSFQGMSDQERYAEARRRAEEKLKRT